MRVLPARDRINYWQMPRLPSLESGRDLIFLPAALTDCCCAGQQRNVGSSFRLNWAEAITMALPLTSTHPRGTFSANPCNGFSHARVQGTEDDGYRSSMTDGATVCH
jgi:hypothetical protein